MTWDKETERFLNDYQSGKIPKMKDDLESLLFPFDFNNVEKVRKDWQTLSGYETKITEYKQAALGVSEETNSEVLKQATQDIVFIGNRIHAKREFAKDTLDKALLKYQEEFSQQFKENDVNSLQESKESLRKIRDIADAVEYVEWSQQSVNLENLCDKKIHQLLEEETNRKEQSLFYDHLLKDSKNKLRKGTSTKKLQDIRQQLYEASIVDDSATYVDKVRFEDMVGKYDNVIKNRNSSSKKKLWKRIGLGVGVAVIAGVSYLGINWIKDARDEMHGRAKERQEQVIDSLSQEQHAYVAKINKLEQKYNTVSSQVQEKEQEFESIDTQVQEKSKELEQVVQSYTAASILPTKAAPIVNRNEIHRTTDFDVLNHLKPVLEDAKFTVYVEKNANKTYVVENKPTEYVLHGPFAHSDGSNPSPKTSQGQRRTPEGVYKITKFSFFGDNKVAPFGRGFWNINYPNSEDVQAGYTGGGVGLCSAADYSVEQAINAGRDVMHSGVAVQDNAFEKIRSLIGDGSGTQVVIEDYAKRPLVELR